QPPERFTRREPAAADVQDRCASARASASLAARIERKLREPLPVAFRDAPLRDALADIMHVTKVKIVINEKALGAAGIDPATPVSLAVEDISLRSVLKLIVSQARLTYVVEGGAIEVTTREDEAARHRKQAVYAVADLVIPLQTRKDADLAPLPSPR